MGAGGALTLSDSGRRDDPSAGGLNDIRADDGPRWMRIPFLCTVVALEMRPTTGA